MSQKRVFLVDDESMLRDIAREWLEDAGHKVVLEAASLPQALGKIGEFESEQVDVAILDGNLTKGDTSGKNGETIAQAIRKRFPNVKIVCLSHGGYDWSDLMFSKGNIVGRDGSNPLGEAVSAL